MLPRAGLRRCHHAGCCFSCRLAWPSSLPPRNPADLSLLVLRHAHQRWQASKGGWGGEWVSLQVANRLEQLQLDICHVAKAGGCSTCELMCFLQSDWWPACYPSTSFPGWEVLGQDITGSCFCYLCHCCSERLWTGKHDSPEGQYRQAGLLYKVAAA